jgi:hypothetical protein
VVEIGQDGATSFTEGLAREHLHRDAFGLLRTGRSDETRETTMSATSLWRAARTFRANGWRGDAATTVRPGRSSATVASTSGPAGR